MSQLPGTSGGQPHYILICRMGSGPQRSRTWQESSPSNKLRARGELTSRRLLTSVRDELLGLLGMSFTNRLLSCCIFYSEPPAVGSFTHTVRQRLNCSLHAVSNSPATLREPPLFSLPFSFLSALSGIFVKETSSFKPFKKYQKTLVENNLKL